jgi:ankyrin repeat protein
MRSSSGLITLCLFVGLQARAYEPERDAWLVPEPPRLERDARPRIPPLEFARIHMNGNDVVRDHATDREAALIKAVERGERERVEKLLVEGANPNRSADVWGRRALIRAVDRGDVELIRLLLDAGADPDLKGEGTTPLVLAALRGHARATELLLRAGADPDLKAADGNTPLIAAALMGHAGVVRALLPHKPDFTLWNNAGLTRLGLKTTATGIAAHMGNVEVLGLLLEAGADPNHLDRDLNPPLFHAVYARQRGAILMLLRHGAEASTMSVDAY